MRHIVSAAAILACVLGLAACSTSGQMPNLFGPSQPEPPPQPEVVPTLPPAFPPQNIVGRWGLAAYHKPEDRVRTENAARGQCRQPYVIGKGPTGGVIMHLADEATPQELRVKGSRSGKNYIGPAGPPGGPQDREIVSFDGRVLTTKFMDPDAATRYGTMVYVRCAPRA